MRVAVMQVVDDPDVRKFQLGEDGKLVFGLAKPAAVVVKPDRAAMCGCGLGDRPQAVGLGRDALPLLIGSACRLSAARHPKLRLDAVGLEHFEQFFSVGVQSGKPNRGQVDAVLLQLDHFGLERGDVLVAPIVCVMPEAQTLQQGHPLDRSALFRIERNDAPGDQVIAGIQICGSSGRRLFVVCASGKLDQGQRRDQDDKLPLDLTVHVAETIFRD